MLFIIRVLACFFAVFLSGHSIAFEQRDYVLYEGLYNDDSTLDYILFPHQAVALSGSINVTLLKETGATPYVLNTLDGSDERYSLITADQSKLNTLLREKKLTPATNHHLIYGDLDEDGKSDIVLQPKSDFGNLIVIRDVSESPILSVFSMADLSHHLIGSNSVTLTIADGKLVLTSKAYGEIRLRLDFTETPSSDNSTTPSLIGAIPYDAWVDVSGAARYQVPIRLPSGINHLQPNLSLDYNSNRGNGVAGVGWSLSGTPVISRCSANIAEDGYNSGIQFNEKDRYCLNGQKLISVSGTYGVDGAYYTLEKDNSFRIISHGGEDYNPRYWQVTDAQGKVWYYGQKPGARLNDGDRRISWFLDRVVGITGNAIDYTYDNSNESGDLVIRLAKINYAGTEVTFSYQARNDVNSYYLAGAKRIEDKLLTEIKITNSADNAWNNRYLLNYDKSASTDRSQLTSIMLCGQECLSPTVFNYEGKESSNFQAISSTSLGNFKDFQFIPMNINGDGFQDFVQIRKSDSFYEFIVFMNARNGSYYQSQIERFNDSENALPSRRFYAIDVNRDGLDDLIDIEHRQGQDKYITWVSNGRGHLVSDKQKRLFGSKDDGTLPASFYRIIDLNGDGYQDMFDIYRDENTAVARVTFGIEGGIGDQTVTTQLGIWNKFANPNTSNIQFVDTNGDGVLDIFAPYRLTPNSPISSVFQVSKSISESRYTIVVNKGDGRFEQAIESEYMYGWNDEIDKQPSFLTMDFNGDGLKDVIKVREDNGNTKLGAWVNTGNDEFIVGYRETTLLDGWQSPINPTRPKYFALDINQDGAEDLVYTHVVNDHTVLEGWVSLKNGKFSRYSQTTINDRGDETVFFMADTNGDSINEVVEIYNNAGSAKVDSWSTSISPYQDKLKSAETGLALSTTFDYGLTSNTLFYRASEFPKGTVQTQSRARPIVFGMGYDSGLGDVSQQYYRYYDLKTHTQGIGNLGFTKIEKFDLGQNIAEVTQFNQDWKARRYASVKKKEVCALTDTFNFSNYSGTNYCITDSTNLLERESHFWVSDIYAPDKSSRGRCTDNNCSSAEPSKVTFHVNKHQSLYEKWGANNDFISKQLVKRTYNDTGQLTRTVTQHGTGVSEYDLNGGFGLFDIQVTEQDDYTYDTNLAAKHIYKPTSVSRSVVGSNLADTSNTTHFQYDANGVLTTKVIEPGTDKQIIETFSNFDRGLPGLITRSWLSSDSANTSLPTNSASEQYHYDVNGSVSLMRDALGYTQTFTEHPLYAVQSSYTDINGQTTTTEVDVLGRVLKTVAPQSTTYYEYKDCNACTNNSRYYVYKTTTAQPAEKVYYDTLGREVKSEKQILNGTWSQVTTEYNTKGQVTKVSVPSLGTPSLFTVYEYDNTGRMTLENRPASDHSIAYRYDGLLHTKDETFSGGTQTSKNMMNVFGLLDYGLDAMGNKTQYFYNGRKQLVKTIDVDGNAIDIEYDIHGYRTKLIDPDKGTWTYTNNAFGLVASETNGNGLVTGFNYDLLGRMTSRTNSEGTSSWQYDSDTSGVGQLSKATQVSSSGKGTYVEDYSYDGFGNLEKKVVNYGDGQTAEMNWHYV
ncbi:hypothetical protein TW85_24735, partial [Marinomonas sp. S3726]|uniref:SpvB/TcaC N-terminal domain-containing protein n=1 Tax=Marinomonas sp. S3726 TaxID=579484 RepID=UPI0005FA119F